MIGPVIACIVVYIAGNARAGEIDFSLRLDADRGQQFPPGGRFPPINFWTASPSLQEAHPVEGDVNGPSRPSRDFIASGEADMLAWQPPAGAERVQPLADTQTLVRWLGGLGPSKLPDHRNITDGDVVYRDSTGALVVRWPMVFERLEPFINNSINPIVVLDNVPWAFAPSNASRTAKYGNNMGPVNVTEYAGFLKTLAKGIVDHFGVDVANTLAFRVGTEPDTQPGHWGDTTAKYIEMYLAADRVFAEVIPGAKFGPGNFAADGPTRETSWDNIIVPIVKGIVAGGGRIDFLAMSCYGRAIMCDDFAEAGKPLDRTCEYSPQFSTECAQRLSSLKQLLPQGHQEVPMQTMEYGNQENSLHIVDSQPGAWGGAWTLASSIQMALGGIERVYHWGYGDRGVANGQTVCPKPLTACGFYGGNIWVAAAAGHLFGTDRAVVLNSDVAGVDAHNISASGLGGISSQGEVRLLLSLFAVQKSNHTPVHVTVTFAKPMQWASNPLSERHMVLNRTTSLYDLIFRNASEAGHLKNSSDPNVYTLRKMLSDDGIAIVKKDAEKWFQTQNRSYSPSAWLPVSENAPASISCSGTTCQVQVKASPPSVVALWFSSNP